MGYFNPYLNDIVNPKEKHDEVAKIWICRCGVPGAGFAGLSGRRGVGVHTDACAHANPAAYAAAGDPRIAG